MKTMDKIRQDKLEDIVDEIKDVYATRKLYELQRRIKIEMDSVQILGVIDDMINELE